MSCAQKTNVISIESQLAVAIPTTYKHITKRSDVARHLEEPNIEIKNDGRIETDHYQRIEEKSGAFSEQIIVSREKFLHCFLL